MSIFHYTDNTGPDVGSMGTKALQVTKNKKKKCDFLFATFFRKK
jgi:hypothetical protein